MSGKGILSLVTTCRRLEVLELENAKRVGRETIDEILQMLTRAKESKMVAKAVVNEEEVDSFELRRITLSGYPFVVVGNPLRLEDTTSSKIHWRQEGLARHSSDLCARMRERLGNIDNPSPAISKLNEIL